MRQIKRALFALVAIIAAAVYVWVAAVRAVPEVRRRKAARRAARRRST